MLLLLFQLANGEIPPPDRDLREAQTRFEFVRRANLPIHGGVGSRCDVRVGRFCYWYDSAPPPKVVESPEISEARGRLLGILDSAGRVHPNDAWIAGQRVRYLLEAGRVADAVTIECGAARWWCAALRGFALHVNREYARADTVFDAALAAMPPALRCEWMDFRSLLEGALARELESLPCAGRERMAAHMWRLAQPLWMTDGSDVRTEYLSRRTLDMILSGGLTPHGFRWGSDTRELLLRYGWSETYTRAPSGLISGETWQVTGHNREPSWNVLPALESPRDRWITSADWDLRASLARMRYAPRHLTALYDLPHQLARFPRRDSMLVAVKAYVPEAMSGEDVQVGLGAWARRMQEPAAAWEGFSDHRPPGTGARILMVPGDTSLVSVEAYARRSGRGARARYSIAPLQCGRVCVSDLLLFAPLSGQDSLTLAQALDRSIPPRISGDASLGVWWETHAVPGARLSMRLTLEPTRGNPLRRVAEALRLTAKRSAIRMRWEAVWRPEDIVNQLVVRLPEGASGAYRLSLSADDVTATRLVEITPD